MGTGDLEFVNFAKDLKVQDLDLLQTVQRMQEVKKALRESEVANAPDFEERFSLIYRRLSLQEEIADVEYLVSEESLTHLKDYQDRIAVRHMVDIALNDDGLYLF
jgi:superfamily II RNA helicase